MSRLQSVLASVTLVGAALVPFALATTAVPASAATFNVQPVAGTAFLTSVACSTATSCVAVGTSGTAPVVVAITNGVPGSPQSVTGVSSLNGVACSDATTCVAVGKGIGNTAVVVPIVNGVAGSPQVVTGANRALNAVACSSAISCVAVGAQFPNQGSVVPITNGTPGPVQLVPVKRGLTGVACYGPTACVAVGQDQNPQNVFDNFGVLVPISNGSAGVAQRVTGTNSLIAIGCGVSVCEATGTNTINQPAVVQIVNGVPGAPQVSPSSINNLSGIACPTDTLCEAVGSAPAPGDSSTGVVVPVHSGVPTAGLAVPGTGALNAIACTSASSCVAVGQNAAQLATDQVGVVVTVVPDNTPPTCAVSAVRAGPPKQLDLTAQDTGGGIATITVVSVSNGTVSVPEFTPGTTSPVVITATKTDQSKPTVFNVDVTDVDGNTTHCR